MYAKFKQFHKLFTLYINIIGFSMLHHKYEILNFYISKNVLHFLKLF